MQQQLDTTTVIRCPGRLSIMQTHPRPLACSSYLCRIAHQLVVLRHVSGNSLVLCRFDMSLAILILYSGPFPCRTLAGQSG